MDTAMSVKHIAVRLPDRGASRSSGRAPRGCVGSQFSYRCSEVAAVEERASWIVTTTTRSSASL